jgi:hypothetical protein
VRAFAGGADTGEAGKHIRNESNGTRKRRIAEAARVDHGRPPRENEPCLTLFRGYGGEGRNQLVDVLAVALRAPDLCLLDVGGVVLLGEFLVAVRTVKDVLRHRQTPEPT